MSTTVPNISSDSRLALLLPWLQGLAGFNLDLASIRPASSDASFRRYFRVNSDKGSYIVMDAPPDKERIEPFVHVDELFKASGVAVPEILARNVKDGFLLLSDLGNRTYLTELTEDNADRLYREALHALVRIQVTSRPGVLPEYDREALLRELKLFPEWYITKHLGKEITPSAQKILDRTFDILLANNLAQPQVFVHRDYHSRNLMYLESGNPGILDFQDALYGPVTYDLVSLLKDAYVEWDEERILDLVIRYWENARKVGLPVNPDIDQFYRDFEFMGVQRHLKVLGIFARLYHRDGKENYLKDIPLVMKYTSKAAHRYSELAPLAKLLDDLQEIEPGVTYSF